MEVNNVGNHNHFVDTHLGRCIGHLLYCARQEAGQVHLRRQLWPLPSWRRMPPVREDWRNQDSQEVTFLVFEPSSASFHSGCAPQHYPSFASLNMVQIPAKQASWSLLELLRQFRHSRTEKYCLCLFCFVYHTHITHCTGQNALFYKSSLEIVSIL